MMKISVKDIVAKAGGPASLGRRFGISPAAVSKWPAVPPDRVLGVAEATGWAYTPHQIRPDLYPNPLDALPAEYEPSPKPSPRPASGPGAKSESDSAAPVSGAKASGAPTPAGGVRTGIEAVAQGMA